MFIDFFTRALSVAVLVIVGVFVIGYFGSPINLNVNTVATEKDAFFEVSDTAKVFAAPDTASLQVAVVKEGLSVDKVQAELNVANNEMIEAIQNVGIDEDDIRTVNYSINPKYDYDRESGEQNINGYRATSRLEVRTDDFDKINQIVDAATRAGANEVGQVSFVTENRDEYVAEARKEAIESAKKKAQEIASEAGIDLGRIVDVRVSEGGVNEPVYMEARMEAVAMDSAANKTSIQPGQNEVNVSVTLSYALN